MTTAAILPAYVGPHVEEEYHAYGAAAALFRAPASVSEIVLGGPANTGKTRALLEYGNYVASEYPNARIALVRKTRRSLTESAMVTLDQKVLHPAQGVRFMTTTQRYEYPNGSIIAVGGMDNPDKIMGSEWDVILVSEATELLESDWQPLTSRMGRGRTDLSRIVGDCNPNAPTHWIRARAATGQLLLLESRHEDNPKLWDGQHWTPHGERYLAQLDALTGVRKLRLRLGLWVAAEGMVYEDAWSRERCLLPRAKHCGKRTDLRGTCGIDPTWPRYLGIDWGYRNPLCVKWYARLPDGELLVYREVYETMRLVEDVAREALALMGWQQSEGGALLPTSPDADPLPREIIADHDAEDRATWERHFGMSVYPADKGKDSISDGVQAVTKRLHDGRLLYLEGSLVRRDPLLEAAKRPCSSVDEFESYVWDTRGGRAPKEVPMDEHNHGMDVDRYVVTYFDRATPDAQYIPFHAPGYH